MGDEITETWRHNAESKLQLLRVDGRGNLFYELINGVRNFHLTRSERDRNMVEYSNSKSNPFLDGTCTAINLVESDPDLERVLASSANAMSESDMVALYEAHWKTFEKRVGEVDNPITLQRLLGIGEEGHKADRKVTCVRDRLAELGSGGSVSDHESIDAGGEGLPAPQKASFYDMDGPVSTASV